jgi:hypothetical protein
MFERRVTLKEVKDAIRLGKIIETYSKSTPYPSVLLLYWNDLRPLHVVVATDSAYKTKHVITVYESGIDIWEVGFERRRS